MKQLKAEFIFGSTTPGEYPPVNLPEVAFSGRSNVGKSSLINSIALRKNLAKISSNPGKTKQINFFDVAGTWRIADLPGFGYAVVSKTEREKWLKLNLDYLENRKSLPDGQAGGLPFPMQSGLLLLIFLFFLERAEA